MALGGPGEPIGKGWDLRRRLAEPGRPIHGAVALVTGADDLAGGHIERGEQRERAVPRPTMSRTLSTNNETVDSLKVSARCGCRPKSLPDPVDRGGRVAGRLCHVAPGPIGRIRRRLLQRPADRLGDLIVAAAPPGQRVVKTLEPMRREVWS